MTSPGAPRFQAVTFKLIGVKPKLSRAALKLLEKRERDCGVMFPPSVREWYTFGGPKIGRDIGCGETSDELISLRELGRPIPNWYGKANADFVRAGLLLVICENQGVCNWAVKLDGSDDPPVVIEVDSSDKVARLSAIRWQPCAASFSTFMQSRAWDHGHSLRRTRVALQAQERRLKRSDREFLLANFSEGPRTYGHPGVTNYRFFTSDSSIIVWDGEDHVRGQTDWFLQAASGAALLRLARQLWRCGTLRETLRADADDARSQKILERLRSGEPHLRKYGHALRSGYR